MRLEISIATYAPNPLTIDMITLQQNVIGADKYTSFIAKASFLSNNKFFFIYMTTPFYCTEDTKARVVET